MIISCICSTCWCMKLVFYDRQQRAPIYGRAGLKNHRPSRSCTERERIRFLGSALRDWSIASSTRLHSHHDSSTSVPVGFTHRRQLHLDADSRHRQLYPIIDNKETYIYVSSLIMSFILHILFCLTVIVLNDMLDCAAICVVLDLSRSCVDLSSGRTAENWGNFEWQHIPPCFLVSLTIQKTYNDMKQIIRMTFTSAMYPLSLMFTNLCVAK